MQSWEMFVRITVVSVYGKAHASSLLVTASRSALTSLMAVSSIFSFYIAKGAFVLASKSKPFTGILPGSL